MTKPDDPLKNHLLAALPENEFAHFKSKLEPASFKLGEALYESGDQLKHLYFPTTSIVSLLSIMENGATAEIGVAGNEGVVGIALFMGGDSVSSRGVVQSAGNAFKLNAETVQKEFARGGKFQQMLLRYTQALIAQISQTAVCNRLHSLDQQLCRWLLLSHDRLDSNKLKMTHDLISDMMGVRREGVTLAAKKLQDAKLISYARGTIMILDRRGLEARVCECYKVVNDEYNRLLGRGLARTFQ